MRTPYFGSGSILFAIFVMCSFWIGCSGSGIRTMVHQSPNSMVYLEWVEKESFRATHPAILSPTIIHRSLKGVMVKKPTGFMEGLLGQEPKASQMFSDDDVERLLPHLVSALSLATPEEQVVFQRMYSPKSESVKIAGTLHIRENLLFLTFTKFNYKKAGSTVTLYKGNRQIPDPSGFEELKVSFTPEKAWRHDVVSNQELLGQSSTKALVLDLTKLASLPPDQIDSLSAVGSKEGMVEQQSQPNRFHPFTELPEQTGFESQDEVETQSHRSKKALEIKDLEEKFRFLRRELSEVENEIERLKNNP